MGFDDSFRFLSVSTEDNEISIFIRSYSKAIGQNGDQVYYFIK